MAEHEMPCALPCLPAQHGSVVRLTSGQCVAEAIHMHSLSLCAAASFGRIFIFSLFALSAPLSGMSAIARGWSPVMRRRLG